MKVTFNETHDVPAKNHIPTGPFLLKGRYNHVTYLVGAADSGKDMREAIALDGTYPGYHVTLSNSGLERPSDWTVVKGTVTLENDQ